MGASVLRKKVQGAGFNDVTVVNKAISNLDDSYDLVVTHQDLTDRARQRSGSAIHVSVENFMGSPRYDEIVDLLHQTNGEGASAAESRDCVGGGAGRGCGRDARRGVGRHERRRRDPGRRDHRGRQPAVGQRCRDAGLRRCHARAREVGVHCHGQLPGDPARHQRGEGRDPAYGDLVRALPGWARLEGQGGQVRGRDRRRGQGPPAAARQDRPGLRGQGAGRRARGGAVRLGRPPDPRRGEHRTRKLRN